LPGAKIVVTIVVAAQFDKEFTTRETADSLIRVRWNSPVTGCMTAPRGDKNVIVPCSEGVNWDQNGSKRLPGESWKNQVE
jgi:hypothetical protein